MENKPAPEIKQKIVVKKPPRILTPAKIDVVVKINQMPVHYSIDKNGWVTFQVDADGRIIDIKLRPRMFKQFEDAHKNFKEWTARITGKMGEATIKGFELLEPGCQVFEKKPKESSAPAAETEQKEIVPPQ